MQPPQLFNRFVVLFALAACLMVVVRLSWPSVSVWQQRQLAHRLVVEMEHAEDPHARVLLRQIAGLGDASIAALVEAAASKRAEVSLAARQVLDEKLGTWIATAEVDPKFNLGQPTSLLARALEAQVTNLGPLGQQWSSRLTLELVELADKLPAEEAALLLADCSAILEVVPAVGPRMRSLDACGANGSAPEFPIPAGGQPDLAVLDIPSERAISSTAPQVATPIIKRDEQYTVETDEVSEDSVPSAWEPERSLVALPVTSSPMPPTLKSVKAKTEKWSHLKAKTLRGTIIELPTPDEMETVIADLRAQSTPALANRLTTADFYTTGAIRVVLRERGISEEELSLMERLLSSDPAERLRLVRDVKVLPARPARRWLRELLNDENAEVRLQALTALATTSDPDLVDLAREMAVSDHDARVSELAARIMREAR